MPEKFKAVIADTSCFILLDKIEALHILYALFNEIITSEKVASEFGKPLPHWVKIAEVQDKIFLNKLIEQVDYGEASAIALAMELKPSLLIIDDLKGRKLAEQLSLNYTGSLGVLLKAFQSGIIPSLQFYFEEIKKTNFHISHQLLDDILKEINKQ